jgi:hypothetical protein
VNKNWRDDPKLYKEVIRFLKKQGILKKGETVAKKAKKTTKKKTTKKKYK